MEILRLLHEGTPLMLTHPYIFIGSVSLVLGLAAGFVMHRSDFCMAGMFRDLFLFKRTAMIKSFVLLVLSSMLLFEAARQAGLLVRLPLPAPLPPHGCKPDRRTSLRHRHGLCRRLRRRHAVQNGRRQRPEPDGFRRSGLRQRALCRVPPGLGGFCEKHGPCPGQDHDRPDLRCRSPAPGAGGRAPRGAAAAFVAPERRTGAVRLCRRLSAACKSGPGTFPVRRAFLCPGRHAPGRDHDFYQDRWFHRERPVPRAF